MEPNPISLIKSKHGNKSEEDFVKPKLCRDTTSSSSDLYKFHTVLFDTGELEEFLLFMENFNMNFVVSWMLTTGKKIKYMFTIVHGEVLCHFDLLYADREGVNPLNVKTITLRLASHFFPLNSQSK